jgi:DNA-binding beta-propeller fold protein YncE
MSRSGVRFSALLRSRRGRLAAPAVLGALALAALAAPSAAAVTPTATKPRVIATIKVPPGPNAIAVSPLTGYVYVTGVMYEDGSPPPNSGSITAINGRTNKVSTTIQDANDYTPSSVLVSPKTGDIYVGDHSGVSVVNGRTNTIIATVKDNDIPSELAVSPRTGDVYVVNEGDYLGPGPGGVWLINGRTSKVTATIADPDWPNAIAVSPRTGDVYVTNAVLGSPTVWVIAG